MAPFLRVKDLGRMGYSAALEEQRTALRRVLAARTATDAAGDSPHHSAGGFSHHSTVHSAGDSAGLAPVGELLLVEHDPPVITLGRRRESASHVNASTERLAALGVELVETDRGGDVTWHGPGQLVAYPILDLERLGLRIHPYMRMLEECVIETIGEFGVVGRRDPEATGVWVGADGEPSRKICAMGVRVSRWVSMHGLALNVECDLSNFGLIVPCGLHGRAVTSLRAELGEKAPSMSRVRAALVASLERAVSKTLAHEVASAPERGAASIHDRAATPAPTASLNPPRG